MLLSIDRICRDEGLYGIKHEYLEVEHGNRLFLLEGDVGSEI